MDNNEKLEIIKKAIGTYDNFPIPGIIFKDIFGICKDVTALKALKEILVDHARELEVDIIVGLDSRGFLLGPLISIELAKPFVPIRKKGKLPGNVIQQSYTLEYGEATFEIQTDTIQPNQKVLIVDDLLATGGSMSTAVTLVKSLKANIVECLVVMELTKLDGRSKIQAPVYSLVQYE